jgi:hypothetical protein
MLWQPILYDVDYETKYQIFIISYSTFKFVCKPNPAISILFDMKPPATECPAYFLQICSEYEEYYLSESDILQSSRSLQTFQRSVLLPYSGSKHCSLLGFIQKLTDICFIPKTINGNKKLANT